MDLDTLPDMLRVEEAAAVLRIGRCLRVPKRALLAWIDGQLGDFDAA
jgi:hypothetical protein